MAFSTKLRDFIQKCFRSKKSSEQVREEEFITAVNELKTLRVTARGGMAIDPAELSDVVDALGKEYKNLVVHS